MEMRKSNEPSESEYKINERMSMRKLNFIACVTYPPLPSFNLFRITAMEGGGEVGRGTEPVRSGGQDMNVC